MDEDKMQHLMEFILEQQAQLTVTVGQVAGNVDKLTETVGKLSDKVNQTANGINALLAIAEIHDREIEALKESVNAMREAVNAVDERGRDTDERLNALINTVERYISERRNGNSSN